MDQEIRIDACHQIFEIFHKFIVFPKMHLIEELNLVKDLHEGDSRQINHGLLAALHHCKKFVNSKEQECFRSYALMGEILAVLVVFKIKEEKQS